MMQRNRMFLPNNYNVDVATVPFCTYLTIICTRNIYVFTHIRITSPHSPHSMYSLGWHSAFPFFKKKGNLARTRAGLEHCTRAGLEHCTRAGLEHCMLSNSLHCPPLPSCLGYTLRYGGFGTHKQLTSIHSQADIYRKAQIKLQVQIFSTHLSQGKRMFFFSYFFVFVNLREG